MLWERRECFMWNYIYQDELYHYGVKGMKWGVKKSEYDSMSKDQKKEAS